MKNSDITHYGYNWTHRGHHMRPNHWIPVRQQDVIEKINHLIERESRLCRVWIRRADDSTECVYWYERPAKVTEGSL